MIRSIRQLTGFAAFIIFANTVSAQESVKIGVLAPMTGDSSADWGEQVKQAVLLAQALTPNPPIQFVFEDSQCQGRMAVSAARKLVSIDKVRMIIGDVCWTDLVAKVTEPAQVVVISPGSAQSTVREAGDFVFRLKLDVSVDSRAIARTLFQKTRFSKAAVIFVQDQWGEGIAQNFSEEYQKIGGSIVAREGMDQGSTDFKSLLLRIKLTNPDVLMIAAYPGQVGLIGRQARDMGITVQLASYGGSVGAETFQLGGNAVDGLLFLQEFDPDLPSEPTKSFVSKFQEQYKRKPNLFGALGFDAYNLYAGAVSKCGTETHCIRDFLYSQKNYPGVSGKLTFDDHGDVLKELKLKKILNGRSVDYSPAEAR